jgi:hypothetical protein
MLPLLEKSSRKSSIRTIQAKEFARALDVVINILVVDKGREAEVRGTCTHVCQFWGKRSFGTSPCSGQALRIERLGF